MKHLQASYVSQRRKQCNSLHLHPGSVISCVVEEVITAIDEGRRSRNIAQKKHEWVVEVMQLEYPYR